MQIESEYNTDLDAATHPTFDITLLVRLLARKGISAAAVLAGSGIPEPLLADAEARISLRQKLIVFENVTRLSADPTIGLRAGHQVRFSHLGILGYAIISSSTFGKGIELGMKYLRLAGPVLRKRFFVGDDFACFQGVDCLSLGRLLPFSTELWFSSMHALMGEMLGHRLPSRKIKLPYPAPSYRQAYEALFQCPLAFDTGVIEWYLDAALLQQPLPNANPLTAKLCAQSCEALTTSQEDPHHRVRQIRSMLLETPGRFPNIETIAERCHMSSRTLRRKLKGLGTSYQQILDDTRERLAVEYLENTRMTIAEIAERVGFTETANFSQAFKKWTGTSPSSLRKTDT